MKIVNHVPEIRENLTDFRVSWRDLAAKRKTLSTMGTFDEGGGVQLRCNSGAGGLERKNGGSMCKTAGNLDWNYSQHRPIILWVKGQLCVRMMNDFLQPSFHSNSEEEVWLKLKCLEWMEKICRINQALKWVIFLHLIRDCHLINYNK